MLFPFTATIINLHGAPNTVIISDYVDDNGRFVNVGVRTAAALSRHEAVHTKMHFVDDDEVVYDTEVIIPYHAVMSWNTASVPREYTKPLDDFCHSTQYTVTFTGDLKTTTVNAAFGEVITAPNVDGYSSSSIHTGWISSSTSTYYPVGSRLPAVTADITYNAGSGE